MAGLVRRAAVWQVRVGKPSGAVAVLQEIARWPRRIIHGVLSLAPGSRLGPYEILAALGAGGMGEVYRARDVRLRRDVAIKVLPVEVSTDPTRRKRFEREAHAVAALSHPHICAIHDVGADNGLDYLVLELVQGETIAARLQRGPMPAGEVVSRAIEMADAIATAHRHGIIHRDLKPGNVMLTRSGAVVLDFGLARIVQDDAAVDEDAAHTMTSPLTGLGVVLGTLQYMAPEQIEGRPADARTDVFAFGAVLFEMLTARRAFDGSSAPAVMGAILRADTPSASAAQPGLPASVDRLVRACLAKDPADRIASMHDVRLALTWIQQDLSQGSFVGSAASPPRPRTLVPTLAAGFAAILLFGVAGYLYGRRSAPAASGAVSYVYNIPLPPTTKWWEGLALSPDARRLAISVQSSAGMGPHPGLWLRELDSTASWHLVSGGGDDAPHYPFWSPDGRSLAFFLKGRLVRVEPPSTVALEICSAADGRGAAWIDDTTIVFAPSATSGLMRVDVRTGHVEEFVPLAAGELGLKYPSAAGNRRVIYWANAIDAKDSELRLVSLDDPRHPVSVFKSAAGGVYDLGTLLYLRSGVWVGQPFDIATGRLSGDPRPVAADLPGGGNVGAPPLSARAGVVAVASRGLGIVRPTWMDRTGTILGTLGEEDALGQPEISADGARMAVARTGQGEIGADIWTIDVATAARRRLTTAANAGRPVWGRGSHIVYKSGAGGATNNIFEIDADHPDVAPHALIEAVANLDPVGWLPDARLVFRNAAQVSNAVSYPRGILIREPDGAHATPFRVGGAEPNDSSLSPDGTRIAFIESDLGGRDLFVAFIPGQGGRPVLVCHCPAQSPRWSRDGRELFFLNDNRLMAVKVSDGAVLTVATPMPLFDVQADDYTVDPKTGRFLMLVPTIMATPSVSVTLNWPR